MRSFLLKATLWLLASLLVSALLILGFNGTLAHWTQYLLG